MAISEEKMRMVIKNYFNTECDINTTIKEAFEKGFRIGVQKGISAQPERNKGKWKVCGTFGDFLKCSCCGYKKPRNEDVFDFCPKCGAEMEKTDAETN